MKKKFLHYMLGNVLKGCSVKYECSKLNSNCASFKNVCFWYAIMQVKFIIEAILHESSALCMTYIVHHCCNVSTPNIVKNRGWLG